MSAQADLDALALMRDVSERYPILTRDGFGVYNKRPETLEQRRDDHAEGRRQLLDPDALVRHDPWLAPPVAQDQTRQQGRRDILRPETSRRTRRRLLLQWRVYRRRHR
jgi:hypothetical protein